MPRCRCMDLKGQLAGVCSRLSPVWVPSCQARQPSRLSAAPSPQPQAPASKIIHNSGCVHCLFPPTVESYFYMVLICSPLMDFWGFWFVTVVNREGYSRHS